MKFTAETEGWNVYRLADGSEVKIRTILVSAKRREGEHGPDGMPAYDLNFQQIMHVDAPDHLKLNVPAAAPAPQRKMDA